ncbi:MAG TPA: DNA-directed RNA polymerase subunit beta, partial [bacterium]|nr:DNA-directed RNA polymerase subunit beta [bacterium]
SKNKDSAFVEIYKRLRPGDLATPDNARALIEAMLYRFDRYDLTEVGRFKLNQLLKLNFPLTKEYRHLHLEDIVEILKGIIKRNNDPSAEPDDIDHLSNRRIRPVGELVQQRARVGLARIRRIVQDRMSTSDLYTLTPAKLINYRPLEAIVRDFFTLGSLSQFMDQTNPLSALEHKRRISAMGPGGLTRERAGFEVRDVHPSHYGRICPIQTPEGINIGLVNHLANFARINPFGFLITPYFKVKNGKITNEIVWLTALEEEEYKIAHGGTPRDKEGHLLSKIVQIRYKGRPTQCKREEVQLIDVAPFQILSVATSLIPFLEHDDANRALMGSNMQRQAVPYLKPEPPLVQTGNETKAAYDSGNLLISEVDGKVVEVDGSKIVIQPKGKPKERKVYWLDKFSRTNQYTCHNQFPRVSLNQTVKKGEPLVDTSSIKDGILSLGKNLLVAFMPFRGGNFEDAIIISERLVKDDVFTSIHVEDFECEVRETKLGPEITTPDIPNVSEEKLKDLDEEGIVRIGAEVKPGDILVGKISPKGEAELSPEERLLKAIFGEKAKDIKDTSLLLPAGKRGRVIGVRVFSREKGEKLEPGVIKKIQIEVAQIRKITAGDKLAGRHGNKGVVAKVLPEEDMPYLEDGTPIDIILNPLSVASRMNIGQILETHLGWAAKKLGYYAITPALAGAQEEEIKEELKKAGLPEDGKVTLYDGYTGEPFSQKVTVGYIYMMKLNHLVEDKIHMRSIGPYSLITQQPLGGKAQMGGQRFGEMEVWALEGYGAAYTLQEMLTIKSDDVKGRAATYESIIKGEKIKT